MRKLIMAAALATATLTSVSATPVFADPPPWAPAHGRRAKDAAIYDRYGRYYEPNRLSYNDRIWRGRDGRYYCRRGNGTTGLVIGAAAGALLGSRLRIGQDRTVSTIIGAAGGALIGRAIDRGEIRCH